MKFWKKVIIIICASLSVLLVFCVLGMHEKNEQRYAGEKIYSQIQSDLVNYPQLPEPYCFTACYFCDDTTEYMLLKNGSKQITGQRNIGEDAIYYTDGKSWQLDQTGELVEICDAKDPAEEKITGIVEMLLVDRDMTYTYYSARGQELPLWVYPDEQYIQCQRPKYFDCKEVMVYNQENNQDYIRWNIVKSSNNVKFYLFACGCDNGTQTESSILIRGWGTLPDGVFNAVKQNGTQ